MTVYPDQHEIEAATKEGWLDDPYAPLGLVETTRRTANLLRQLAQSQGSATAKFLIEAASQMDALRTELAIETRKAELLQDMLGILQVPDEAWDEQET